MLQKTRIFFALFTLFLLSGCYKGENADLIVHNAFIYSCDEQNTVYDAMAIRDGKIIQMGPEREILNGYASDNIIDAQMKSVFPGFHDGHCHFYGFAKSLGEVDLTNSRSFDEVVERIEKYAKENELFWIQGRGWDHTLWEGEELPTNEQLNALFPDQPVLIRRVDGHAALANQKALDLAGITIETKIEGGLIGQEDGVLTGILLDNAYDSVSSIIPDMAPEEKLTYLQKAERLLFQSGLTSINDAGIDEIDRELYIEWYKEGALQIKDYCMLFPTDDNLNYATKNGPQQYGNLSIRSFKIIADGALGSRGACLIHPYEKDSVYGQHDHYGFMVTDSSVVADIALLAKEIDFQVNTHCIGDSANRVLLQIYTNVIQDKMDHRWKIEHAQVLTEADFDLFQAVRIIPSVQPTHCTSDMRWAEKRIGSQRIKLAYAYKTLLEKAGLVVLGTDFPVERIYPLETFYAAITRQDREGFPEGGFYPKERLTREEALKGMTIWPAFSNFEDLEKGSLEAGKSADFVILTKDIMKIEPMDILDTYVEQTYLNGELVYDGR